MSDVQLKKFVDQIKESGFPLEHWASSLLRKEGWIVRTNCYYIDSDDKKPREMDIVAFKRANLDRFKVKTVLLISCKKSKSSAWGFLRRPFPEYGNQTNLFPAMISSEYPPVNYALGGYGWERRFCDFMAERGLSSWFGVPQYDVFAHQQVPLQDKGKLHDSDMHSATMQLIKAQAYEMSDQHHVDAREIKQFNLISLTEGDFVAFDFNDSDDISAVEISEQVSMASYKINNYDHDSRVIYLTKRAFEESLSRFTKLHELNVDFFTQKEEKFRSEAPLDHQKLAIYSKEFIANLEVYVLDCARRLKALPSIPLKFNVNVSVESCGPVVEILSNRLEILDVAHSVDVQERVSRNIQFYWGYKGDVKIKATKID